MIEAMSYVKVPARLLVAGYGPEQTRKKAESMKGGEKVQWLGFLKWPEVMDVLASSDLGLLLLQPTPSYSKTGEGIAKLFEYMMLGLPVLASDFPNTKRLMEENACGLTVDPEDPREVAEKIMNFARNPEAARRMGMRGMKAVKEKYNWLVEEKKLLKLYAEILEEQPEPATKNINSKLKVIPERVHERKQGGRR